MDWWLTIKIIWGGMGLEVIGLILIVVWRAKGVISWNLTIQKELKALADEAETAAPARKKAIHLIVDTCQAFSRSFSPQQGLDVEHLRDFIRSIAACYYPEAERPELQISLGRLIKASTPPCPVSTGSFTSRA